MTTHARKPPEANPYMREAGEKMKQARLRAGYGTQEEASRATERLFGPDGRVPYQQLSRIERGTPLRPALDLLDKLSRTYGVSFEEMLMWYGIDPPHPAENKWVLSPEIRKLIERYDNLPKSTQETLDAMVRFFLREDEQGTPF